MYRIRFHGRGGQGMKTASRILGSAFFLAGFEVQDAPRYGAERRGAPIFAYVRAAREPINERGTIQIPELVVAADETLLAIPAAGVLAGCGGGTVLLIRSREAAAPWKERLQLTGTVLTFSPAEEGEKEGGAVFSSAWAGAAARLTGVISREILSAAIDRELGGLGDAAAAAGLSLALEAYDRMADHVGTVKEGKKAAAEKAPEWIELAPLPAGTSAPAIRVPGTSAKMKTGLWRTERPVIDQDRCRKCWWNCATICPDSAIFLDEAGFPQIDYTHCKGCLVCAAQCPRHAIGVVPEKRT